MKKSLIQLHIAVLLWGFTGVLGKAITLSAPVLVWYRMLLTSLLLLFIISYRKQWVKIETPHLKKMAWVGILMGLHWVAFYAAIKFSNASIALVCLSTASIFTSLLDHVFNKTKRDNIEILLGLLAIVGVYCIYQFQLTFGLGILFGVIAAILSAVFTVINKKVAGIYPARTTVFYEMSIGLVLLTFLMPIAFYTTPNMSLIPQEYDWLWLLILSLCCTVWAQSLAVSALSKLSSFTVTLSVNMEPVYGILLAFLFFNENKELHPGFYIGMGLIFVTVVIQVIRIIYQHKNERLPI